jgi:hypothetical protein
MKPNSSRPSLLRWAGTLLAAVLLIYLFSQQGWQEVLGAIRLIEWWRFIMAFLLMMISRLAVVGRWGVLLRSGGIPIPPRQTLQVTFAGLFASNFLPTTIGGDVVRLAGVARLGYDQAVGLASLVVDRLVGMAGMAMALPLALPGLLDASRQAPVAAFSLAARRPLWGRMQPALQRIRHALALWLGQPRSLLYALGFTWIHMACLFLQVWLLLRGMGEDVPLGMIAGLWSATYFVTLLPVSINGLGVQELSMAFFFTTFASVSPASALVLALLMRVLAMLASLPGAFFIPGILAGAPGNDPD